MAAQLGHRGLAREFFEKFFWEGASKTYHILFNHGSSSETPQSGGRGQS